MIYFQRLFCTLTVVLGGCSLYPMPDDVSPLRTELIVRYGRCEVRDAILAHIIGRGMLPEMPTDKEVVSLIENTKNKKNKFPENLTPQEKEILRLTKVAIVYSFDFNYYGKQQGKYRGWL
ncbi:MAG: hypothetical protein U1E19_03970 [Rhodoblastus sp.]